MEKKLAAYICTGCGIGDVLNIEALSKVATGDYKIPCKTHPSLCSPEGRDVILNDISGEGVNSLVIAGCSPRVMYDVFDFEGCIVDRVNLREQVVWCTEPNAELDDPNEDIQMMAEDYLTMGITKVKKMELPVPYQPQEEISKDIMVVGGGIAGMTAALEAAKAGYHVHLIEKEAKLGGFQKNVRQKATFPYKGVVDNNVAEMIAAVTGHENITVHTSTTVAKTQGGPCLFTVTLNQPGAAKPAEGEEAELPQIKVGSIVEAAGWKPYDPNKLPETLAWGKSPNIITNTMFEEQNKGAQKMNHVAFIQCAGSRDPDYLPYCSTICCTVSLKQAIQVKNANPDASVFVIYKELRTPGQAEDLYRKAQELGVTFIRCQEPKVRTNWDGSIVVEGIDELLNEEVEISGLDLLVLATGMVPVTSFGKNVKVKTEEDDTKKGADEPPLPLDVIRASNVLNLAYRQGPELPDLKYGFQDSHFICFPYESRRTGIFPAGCVRRPMGSASTFEDATGAAMKAIQAVEAVSEGRALHPRAGDLSFPEFYMSRCTQCRRCTDECPFGAINEDEKGNPVPLPTRCRRCGVCMGACPERIISFKNYSVDMIGSALKELEIPEEDEEKPRVLVFACENDAYPALDMAGIKRLKYSPYIRVIPLRCLGSLNLVWLADALSTGYDGILLLGCRHGDDYQCHFIKGSELAAVRLSKISETLSRLSLEPERIRVEEVSITDWERVPQIIEEFMETIDDVGPNPFKDL